MRTRDRYVPNGSRLEIHGSSRENGGGYGFARFAAIHYALGNWREVAANILVPANAIRLLAGNVRGTVVDCDIVVRLVPDCLFSILLPDLSRF
jgi:hypothetical protein